jgi:hypothetical protein
MWIATVIVTADEEKRTLISKKFIRVAQWCYSFGNFNTLMEVIGGLEMWLVERLLPFKKVTICSLFFDDSQDSQKDEGCLERIKEYHGSTS